MLKPNVLHDILCQANSGGVKSTVYGGNLLTDLKNINPFNSLLTEDGSLLASAGENVNIVTAIFSNIWSAYEKCGNVEYFLADQEVCPCGLII